MSKKPELKDLPGVGPKLEEKLREAGIKTVLSMSRAKADKLAEKVDGLSESGAAKLIEAAQAMLPDATPKKKTAEEKKPVKKAEPKPEKKVAPKKEKPEKVEEEKPKKKKAEPKKKAAPKKKPKYEVPLRVKNTDQRMLKIAREKKKRKPSFDHELAHRWTRVRNSWRRPKGIDSATRQNRKGRVAMVSTGYRTPKAVRDLHPSLYVEIRVHKPSDLDELDPELHAVRIASTVGFRKRQEIIAAADAKLLRILNPGRGEEVEEEDLFTDLDLEVD